MNKKQYQKRNPKPQANPNAKPDAKPQNPLLLSVLGVMLIVFGVVDMLILDLWVGIALTALGLALGAIGLNNYNKIKKR
ncbi:MULTISPECIES: hypothetical protein [Cohnella]|uniref:hypothetical protein n=1 Tax=Cohnella TaxID=329857 RepID=UPI0009BB33AC|nr:MULTISPECIES: hypothetical protein [Cohnella]MBN2980207.1 hypothetical protein [Cohnella algarum]